MLYAAPVWAAEINSVKARRKIFNKVYRLAAIRIIRAYRTVSIDAATMIAGTPPVDIIAMKYLEIYKEIKNMKERGLIITAETRKEIRDRIFTSVTRQWKRKLKKEDNEGGARIRSALLPILDDWINREEGEINFEITQVLTGHGVFKHYLWRMAKTKNPECQYCKAEFQDQLHILYACPKWSKERMLLKAKLCVPSGS